MQICWFTLKTRLLVTDVMMWCYCREGVWGCCCAIRVIYTGPKSGCELVTFLSDRRLLLQFVNYMGHTYGSQIWGLDAHILTVCVVKVWILLLLCNAGDVKSSRPRAMDFAGDWTKAPEIRFPEFCVNIVSSACHWCVNIVSTLYHLAHLPC